jgi:hypothetical protein
MLGTRYHGSMYYVLLFVIHSVGAVQAGPRIAPLELSHVFPLFYPSPDVWLKIALPSTSSVAQG